MRTLKRILVLVGLGIIFAIPAYSGGVVTTNTEAALIAALSGGGTVTFASDMTITVTSIKGISANTVIDGSGHTVTISGGSSTAIFYISLGTTLTLTNMVISDGVGQSSIDFKYGGAIDNRGSLIANNCNFINNHVIGQNGTAGSSGGGAGGYGQEADGGVAYNEPGATASFTNCVFNANSTIGGNGGNGGGASSGTGGDAGGGGYALGGAIYNYGTLSLDHCYFNGCTAAGGNGGFGGHGPAGNGAGGSGGSSYGGAVYNFGTATIIGCTVAFNHTISGASHITTVVANFGGGIANSATSTIVNCTLAGNRAFNTGSSTEGLGGNLYNSGTMGVTNCTSSGGWADQGGNIYNDGGTANLKNTLLDSPATGLCATGTITDQGNNLSSDNTPSSFPSNRKNLYIGLATLTDNTGPTLTMALLAGSPAINAGDDTVAPYTDQRGYFRTGTSDIGAYEYNGTPLSLWTLGPTASLDGNVGLFFLGGPPSPLPYPLAINLSISGTASNGVDYVQITNSYTMPAGSEYVQIPIRGVAGAFSGTNKSVILTMLSGPGSGSQFAINTNLANGTITLFDHNTYDATKRYVHGSSTAPDFQSFVVPIDLETGVPLAATGGNASTLFPGNAWTNTLYHFDATNTALQPGITNRIAFQNPIVAFGSSVGGSPLYLNQHYTFGVYAGVPIPPVSNLTNALRIQVYYRSNSAYAGTINLTIPNATQTSQLTSLVTNGFTQTFDGFGLETVMLVSTFPEWGRTFSYDYILTHSATPVATNYYYEVEEQGIAPYNYLVLNASNQPDWSRLYVMEFTPFPALRSTFIDQPHFDGSPLPSAYEGKSVLELTNVSPTLPDLSALVATNYLTLDASPELRRHPTLDHFVSDMGNDPLALASYVINEIDLTDPIDYDPNYNSQPAVNLGGVDRSALATFQEGQGSPVEQCALLVYLLRQAGVPAAYVYPATNGLQMLDSQMSKLLRVQLHGALNQLGQTNLPQLISVNYPWVAAYVGTNWVHIFPWLKDTEISEGLNVYDYLPTNYNSGYKWLSHFITGDPNIFSLSESDQPLDLLPAFIQQSFNASGLPLSVDDMGMQIINRRHLYAQWSDFPKPFSLSGTPSVIESLKTNLNLFNTIQIHVYSKANTNKYVDTTEMRVADLHNRKLLLKFNQVGGTNAHDMILSLSSYATNITNVALFNTNADATFKLTATNRLGSTDDSIGFLVTHRRNKFLPPSYGTPSQYSVSNLWQVNYFEIGTNSGQMYQDEELFRKGDMVTFCLDVGRVSSKMLNVWAQEIWQFNRNVNTNVPSTIDPDIYEGTTAYLTGMSYFNYLDRFDDFNDRLHKVQVASRYAFGFGLIRPQRDASGNLVTNGVVNLITPAVHMPNNGEVTVFNNTARADSPRGGITGLLDWWLQQAVAGSAAEHGVLRSFYQTNAISTVKLLQQSATNIVMLNADNYLASATNLYHGVQLQFADTNNWKTVLSFFSANDYDREVFLTPGVVTNGTYIGMGGLFISFYEFIASAGGLNSDGSDGNGTDGITPPLDWDGSAGSLLDGGIATSFPTTIFTSQNGPNITVNDAPDDSVSPYYLQTGTVTNNSSFLVNGASTYWSLPTTYNNLASGQVQADPALAQSYAELAAAFGTAQNGAAADNQLYNLGTAGTWTAAYNDPSQRASDPVNVMNGEFYIDSADVTLPGPMPLQIRRNYGSLNLAENEFGFGWKISYVPFLSVGTNSTLIYAAEMDGSLVAYRQTGTNANLWLPTAADNPTLNNNSSLGIGSVANLFNNRLQLAVVSGTNVYTLTGADGSVRTFTQRSYPIGSFTRQRPYLDTWFDNRGNSYAFQYGNDLTQPDYGQVRRVQSSNGNFAGFYYDVYGHIIEAYTGDGRRLEYEYDKYGDLVTITFPDESQIGYRYQHLNQVTNSVTNLYSTHLIIEEDKPNGRVLHNVYDSQRRVTNQLATVGTNLVPLRNATFAYTNNFSLSSPTNLLTGSTGVYDYTNHLTTYFYTNSLIRKIVDPLNQTIIQNWFESDTNGGYRRSLQSRIDKRKLQIAYQYDTFGNVTNTTLTGDLLGAGNTNDVAVTSATYNTNNLPTLIVDPVGNETQIIYSTNYLFLPQQVIQLAGTNPVTANFSIYTNATTAITVGTNVSTNTAFGLLTRTIRAYGSVDAATNDAIFNGQGLITSTIQYTGTSDPNVTNQFLYNERNELVQRTDAAGRKYVFLYDPMGRPAGQETYEAGASTPMDFSYAYYNENGDLTWTDGPRYNPEDYIWRDYDGAGRKVTEIHWRSQAKPDGSGVQAPVGDNLYATIFYQYDPFGNLIQTIDPLGNYVVQNFDAIGQMTRQVFYASNGTAMKTNGFAYEPGGLVSAMTNALGGVTTKRYTSTGKLEFQSNPDGSTNTWQFDLSGRPTREVLRNGNFWQSIYDDLHLKISKVFSNATSQLTTNLTQLDHRGNVIRSVDTLGNDVTNSFDGLDRLKTAAGQPIATVVGVIRGGGPPSPGGGLVTNITRQFTTRIYDSSGQVLTVTNALGESTVTTNDALGRPIQVAIYPSNSVTAVRVTSTFYSADHQSVTVTNGTGTNAIVTTTYTDNEGHTLLTIGFPTNGVTEFNWWQYDLAGNRIAQQQCSSNASGIMVWATNGWTYDGLNRVRVETSKDGVSTTNSYDALNDVTNRAMPGGLTWSATYTNDGRILSEKEQGGALTARSMSYQYYLSGDPFVGLLQIVTDGRSTTRSNAYDDFIRLATVITSGSAPEQNTSTAYQYDLRNLVTNIAQAFMGTNFGPAMVFWRELDTYGRVRYQEVDHGSDALSGDLERWDLAGRRKELDGLAFTYRADGRMTGVDDATFGYADNGLLVSRTNSTRTYVIGQRDGRGRILQAITLANTPVGLQTALTENLTWRSDGRLSNYIATRIGDSTLTNDTRVYSYSSLAQRLSAESFNVGSSQRVTNNYTVDGGQTGNLGILTSQIASGSVSASWNVVTNGLDGLNRITQAQDNLINRAAYGLASGAATVTGTLDGKPLNIQFDGPQGSGQWRANMDLAPGSHTLQVSATDPSGFAFASTNCMFSSATNSGDTISSTYDGNGNVTQRFWVNSLGQTNRNQTLTWDAFDRLIAVVDRDAQSNGFNWSAVYDPLGRRAQTTSTEVISNTLVTSLNASNQASQVDTSYDPEVEFLELSVGLNDGTVGFKVCGPDNDGVFGGSQGLGGLDSLFMSGHDGAVGLVQDVFGNVLGMITNGVVAWNPARFSGYGPVPGFQSPSLSLNVDLAHSLGWRGKRVDETGLIYLGARMYDPVAGRFLSADPLGHSASMDLYSYCGGDPINSFDPDGRMSKDFYQSQNAPSFSLTAVPNQWSLPDYLVRKEDPMLVDQLLAAGYPKPPGGSLADTVLSGSHDAGYPASTIPGGAPNINGQPLWVDANQVKANDGTIADNAQIVQALRQSGAPESQIQIYQANQPVEGEVVIQGAIPSSAINTRAMTYIVRGGQVFAVAGALNTGINLGNSINRSIDQGTPTPLIAQTVREAGGWGGAWAGFQAGGAIGFWAGIESGPGSLLTGLGGGLVGGYLGYRGANAIGNAIEGK